MNLHPIWQPQEHFSRCVLRSVRRKGRFIRSCEPQPDDPRSLAPLPSLQHAALRQGRQNNHHLALTPADRRVRHYLHLPATLMFFLVDASESMGSDRRMQAAKGAVLSLLRRAYTRRYRVALVTFREDRAEIVLEPTKSPVLAQQRLQDLPCSGATPLAAGLVEALRMIQSEKNKLPDLRVQMVLISDGDANVPLQPGAMVLPELLELGRQFQNRNAHCIVIDSNPAESPSALLPILAKEMRADYYHISRINAREIVRVVV